MNGKVIKFKKIIRGFENRNKHFKKDEIIQLDDDGFVTQDGVDEYGIPIIYIAFDNKAKEIVNGFREEIGKLKYESVGLRTSVGLTKNELIHFAVTNYNEIILDSPDEIIEFQSALKKFVEKWENKLGKKNVNFGHQDDSDIWSGSEFVENKFAKEYNEEYDRTHPKPDIKRPIRPKESE